MAYVWSKERIGIDFNGIKVEKDFLPLDVIDFPVELVSDDGEIYMLWITDDEEGEWWYVVETSREIIIQYIEGKISVRDIFDKGYVYVTFRSYENYNWIQDLVPLKEKIEQGFIKEDELPTYNAKFEADEETIEEIKSLIFKQISIIEDMKPKVELAELTNISYAETTKEIQINIEEIEPEAELSNVSYSEAPEAEISIAA